jgi:hypothetical protein
MRSDNYYIQQQVERQIAAAVTRHIVPRIGDSQREEIVASFTRVRDAQTQHRQMMDDIVSSLLH